MCRGELRLRESYRHKNHDKTTGLVNSEQILTNGDLQWLVNDVIRFVSYTVKACKIWLRYESHHETSDCEQFPATFK